MITLALLLAVLLVSSIALSSMGWSNVLSTARNELVFADRHKEYGAYYLRQEHHRTMVWAFLAAMALLALIIFIPKFMHADVAPLPPIDQGKIVVFDVIRPYDPPSNTVEHKKVQTTTERHQKDPKNTAGLVAVDDKDTTPIDTTDTTTSTDLLGDTAAIGPVASASGGTKGRVNSTNDTGTDTGPIDVWAADTKPEYPGGETALYSYLKKNINYPTKARLQNISGRVVVAFVVEKDGTVTDAKVVKSVSASIDAEALRVVREMVKWNPGKFKGENVAVRFMLPIVFQMK